MASIRKRAWQSGGETKTAWIADYFDQDGRRRLKTFRTKKAADAWLVTARGEVARGVHTPDSTSITLAEAADAWLRHTEANQRERSTIAAYRSHLEHHLLPMMGHVRLSRLTTPGVEAFKDELLQTRSRALTKKIIGVLKSVLKDAKRTGNVAQNVAADVTVEQAGARHEHELEVGKGIPEMHEVRALLEAAAFSPRWRAFLTVAVFTGLRASELRGLAWDHVDFKERKIRVRQRADRWNHLGSPKSKGSRRDLPMSPAVVAALKEWKLACPPGPIVFPTGTGKVESHANIRRGVGPIMVEAGLVDGRGKAKFGLHALRHFYASWLIDQGLNPKRVQTLMGHSTLGMTMDTYAKLFKDGDDHDQFASAEQAVIG